MKRLLICFLLVGMVSAAVVDVTQVEKIIVSTLEQELLKTYSKVDIEVFNHPEVICRAADYKIQVSLPEKLAGMVTIPVTITSAKDHFVTSYLAKVRVFDEVYVYTESLNRKSPLSPQDLSLQVKDITHLVLAKKALVRNPDALSGLRTKKFVRKGDIARADQMEMLPDVLVNNTLSLSVETDQVLLKCDVMALEEGFVGDIIRVKHPKYGKVLLANLVSRTEAELVN